MMTIKELKSKKLYKEYSLVIPFDEVDKEINKKIENLIPTVTIPGFRKGKAPASIIKKKYEDNVLNEVIQNLVNLKTSDLIKEKKFTLFRQPKIDLKSFEKNMPVEIKIKIDLQPEIKLIDFKEIKINKYELNFTKQEKDSHYKNFLETQKNFKKIDKIRKIIRNDRVTINFESLNENLPEYLKTQKNIPIDTSLNQEILPGINKLLISENLQQGDVKEVSIDLTKLLKNEKFKSTKFKIEIISIEENVKFEITDEYLEKNGFKNENELKEILNKNNLDQYNQGLKQIEKKQLMDLLDKNYNFDLPEGVLEDDFNEIWHKVEHAKKEGTLDEDDKSLSDVDLKKRYNKISLRRVKLGVLLQFIAKTEKIDIANEELSKGIMQYASQYPGQEKQIMDYLKKNPSSVESIRGPLLEQKIIDLIISKSTLSKKKITVEQYKKLEEETFNIKSVKS